MLVFRQVTRCGLCPCIDRLFRHSPLAGQESLLEYLEVRATMVEEHCGVESKILGRHPVRV